jgi:hypothetical protein
MTDWFVGQRVVCVDASGYHHRYILSGSLQQGAVYTIREIAFRDGDLGVLLEEIVCRRWCEGNGVEFGFLIGRFRPVVIPEADIAQFEAILRGVEKREVVEV